MNVNKNWKKLVPFKSQLQGIEDIQKRNEIFDSLPDEEKRKEIAYDGLGLVLEGIVLASGNRTYWSGQLKILQDASPSSSEFQSNLLSDDITGCEVCQRGLLMLSLIRLGAGVHPHDQSAESGCGYNIKGFRRLDFLEMEGEYEYNNYHHPYKNNTPEKLANICLNVIHNGNFNETDKTDYLELLK